MSSLDNLYMEGPIDLSEREGDISFVITLSDAERLLREHEFLGNTTDGHPEVFFEFENYPRIVALKDRGQAVWLAHTVKKRYLDFPGKGRFWATFKRS